MVARHALQRLVPGAPQALYDILDTGRGPLESPIRSEIFGSERFAQHGRSLAATHRAARGSARTGNFFPRLLGNIRTLREAHRYIAQHSSTGYDLSPAADWLLDNFHLIEAQLKEIHEGLPRRYYRELLVLQDEPLAGLPRIYGVAWAFVAHTDGAFDDALLTQFLRAYHEVRELNLSEVWALPTTLRVVLIENLRRLAERVAANKAARELANLCGDRIDTCDAATLSAVLDQMNQRGVGAAFLAQMAQRLHDPQIAPAHAARVWLGTVLPDLAAVQAQRSADQVADNLSVSNAVTSLRAIGDADWPGLIAATSSLMRLMLTSPVFSAEHESTRSHTLHGIERLARHARQEEVVVAQTLLDRMAGATAPDSDQAVPAHWLYGPGRPALLRALGVNERPAAVWRAGLSSQALPIYLAAVLLGTAGLMGWMLLNHVPESGSGTAWAALAAVLVFFPASEAVIAVINRLIGESARPRHLPRLALARGVPPEHRTLVVIPAMLTSHTTTRALVHRLQLHHLANAEPHVQFALLTDWADAPAARLPADDPLLADAAQQIGELNQRFPEPGGTPRFLLLHRHRTYSSTEHCWIGWERKRGKLEQLIAALAEGASTAFIDLGALSRPAAGTRYVVTLDSDTQLPPGRLRELVGVAAHPYNQPQLDAAGRSVVRGYGILQPRIVTPLPPPGEYTPFHGLFAGQCGIDPYSAATSEVYQDLFAEGSFTGKGLLHVQALHAVLGGRLPEGAVLSHDLLEGSIARCAAVTDITLIESAPFHADVAASRVHRWTRGDWQLLPFLLRPWRMRLGAINRWKMFDNLRRSLVAPLSLALVVLALATGAVSPWAALALVLAAFMAGPLMGAVAGFSPSRDDVALRPFYHQAAFDLARAAGGGGWHLTQLLEQALLGADAIIRALWRMAVSRRHLLQWTTAETAQAQARAGLGGLLRQHWRTPVAAAALGVLLLAAGTPYPALATALCGLWASGPLWTWWVSRPRTPRRDAELPERDRAYLGGVARDTWRFFERCVGPQDHHLPPDNLQTLPHDIVAHRTSPTNIGLYLLSTACARHFGWIGTEALLDRMEATLATLHRLERYRGHFLNWYDTERCAALLPMYVSTVDSGNLSGHLLAVAQACRELALAPHDGAAAQRALATSRARLLPLLRARATLTPAQRDDLRWCLADHRATRDSAAADVQAQTAAKASGQHRATPRLRALAAAFEQLAGEADFSFLYHRKRHLFHIGFRVAEQELDTGFYDLLASESRLTSLLAIARGDVPVGHWASLGRLFYAIGAGIGLRSWSGSMFEYLMPGLVLDEPHGSVVREACHAAIGEQIAFAQSHDVPWGISESAYAGSDHTLAYQYAPQGVPRLALRRTPTDELVIAPYATALAAPYAPHRACLNLTRLEALGARARYGFIEALDFTPARQIGGGRLTPVSTFMAHHQGMSIVALANLLLGGPAQRWGMANAQIESVASLLHERAPREVSVLYAPPSGDLPQTQPSRAPGLLRELVPGTAALEPTHLLSNGRYSVSLRSNGAGWSRWGRTGITRWRDDALRDALGSFFYVRRSPTASPHSLTAHPAPDPAARYASTFHADRVSFSAEWPDLQAHQTVWVSPEDDIEFRQVVLRNRGDLPLEFDLISAFEVTLADPRADEAHPTFSNLFVRTEWLAAQQALLFERKPRLPHEPSVQLAHFLAHSDTPLQGIALQTDRQRWQGRNHTAARPMAVFDAAPATVNAVGTAALDTGLDPVCALSVRLRLAPGAKAQLTFATAAGSHGATLRAVVDKYRQPTHVQRASLMSATLAGIRLRELRVGTEPFAAIQTLTTALVLSLPRPQRRTPTPDAQACDRRLLWRFGISGDRPIVLVSAGVPQGMGLLRSLTQALRVWAWAGVDCDLVVVNAEPSSYLMPLQRELNGLRERFTAESSAPGTSLHLLRIDELSADELGTLHLLASVRLNADGRPLAHHVQEWTAWHEQARQQRRLVPHAVATEAAALQAPAPVPQGAFAADSGEFRFDAGARQRTLRPWTNVLANRGFGAQITEAGGGYTWALNSRMNQLTGWSNDPVADAPSEWFLLQDTRSQAVWSVTPSAWGDERLSYRVAHGQGYSVVGHHRGELEVSTTWCVDPDTAVKQVRLRLVNRGHGTLHLRAVGIAEWTMGANRAARNTVHTAGPDAENGPTTLLATQQDRSMGFGGGTAFLAVGAGTAGSISADWTCDRRECFDAQGRLVLAERFGQRSGGGLDPCAALSTRLVLNAGDVVERVFLLGYAESPAAARRLAAHAALGGAPARMERARAHWDTLLGATTVRTPDPLFDAMVNRWLLYQTVSCRLWAKAGFYQAGGATGFRDQLQDAMALGWAAPALLRDQIVGAAARQFAAGDVQHWWHAPGGAGVRTHCSDDLLWLPYACAQYLRGTGDATLLDEAVPFLDGAEIPPGAEDIYETPRVSDDEASVYEHAARAIDHSLKVGAHGLPLIGTGDWNDGMNRVGHEGRGESVWLGWFLCDVVARFAPLARARGDLQRVAVWEAAATGWKAALNGPAWDGAWFKRAYFDDGQELGSHHNTEGRIDLIAQAWAVLSDAAPREQQQQALAALDAHLIDRDAGLIRLLDPPLVHTQPSAGYIQAYPPGVRENGGQYAHAGVWALMAQATWAGRSASAAEADAAAERAYRYFTHLSPAHRAQHPTHGAVYGLEPYVMAGDVYTQPPYVGRGGWSWYTGSAAWLHRAAIEAMFGLQQEAETLRFTPCLPAHWPQAELTLRRGGRTLRFVLSRDAQAALAAHAGAQLLPPDTPLHWTTLTADAVFVVPLAAAA